jgi:hypothetical protein
MANKAPDKIQPDPELNTLTAEKLLAKKVARKWRVAKSSHNGETSFNSCRVTGQLDSNPALVTYRGTSTKPQIQRHQEGYVIPFQVVVPPLYRHTPCSASRSLWLLGYAPSLTSHKVCPDTPTHICKSSILTCVMPPVLPRPKTPQNRLRNSNVGAN